MREYYNNEEKGLLNAQGSPSGEGLKTESRKKFSELRLCPLFSPVLQQTQGYRSPISGWRRLNYCRPKVRFSPATAEDTIVYRYCLGKTLVQSTCYSGQHYGNAMELAAAGFFFFTLVSRLQHKCTTASTKRTNTDVVNNVPLGGTMRFGLSQQSGVSMTTLRCVSSRGKKIQYKEKPIQPPRPATFQPFRNVAFQDVVNNVPSTSRIK